MAEGNVFQSWLMEICIFSLHRRQAASDVCLHEVGTERRRSMVKKMLAFFLIGGIILAAGSVSAQTATLKIGSHVPPKSVPVRLGYAPWIKAVEKDAEGTLKFQTFWGGQLSRSPRKQYELMMNGIQDASPVLPSYTQELFPDFSLFALPYLFRDGIEGSIAQWKLYETGLIGGLEKVYVAAVFNNGNSAMHFSKVIKSADDIKGLKIRTAGPEEAAMIKAMGAVPVAMGITQVAESLNRGVIQGSMNGWNANQTFRFTPLLKSHYEEPFGVRSFFLIITKKAYDRLPDKAKWAINKNSGLVMSRKMGEAFAGSNDELREKAIADPKRTVITISEAERKKRFATIFKPFHEEWIRKHPDGQKKYDALMKILADMRKGK